LLPRRSWTSNRGAFGSAVNKPGSRNQLAELDRSSIAAAVRVVNGAEDHDPKAFAARFARASWAVVPGDHGEALHTPESRAELSAWSRGGGG